MKMGYTDAELEAMAAEFEHGITEEHLARATGQVEFGPAAWVLSLIDDLSDLEQLEARAAQDGVTVHEVVRTYLH